MWLCRFTQWMCALLMMFPFSLLSLMQWNFAFFVSCKIWSTNLTWQPKKRASPCNLYHDHLQSDWLKIPHRCHFEEVIKDRALKTSRWRHLLLLSSLHAIWLLLMVSIRRKVDDVVCCVNATLLSLRSRDGQSLHNKISWLSRKKSSLSSCVPLKVNLHVDRLPCVDDKKRTTN